MLANAQDNTSSKEFTSIRMTLEMCNVNANAFATVISP